MKKRQLYLFLIGIILSACSSGRTLPIVQTYTSLPSKPYQSQLTNECLDIKSGFPVDLHSRDVLVLASETSPHTYLRDMTNGSTIELASAGSLRSGMFVSPDGKWLAFEEPYPNLGNFTIVGSDGDNVKRLHENGLQLIDWLNNQQLVFRIPVYIPTSDANPVLGNEDMTVFPSFLVLNPFTGNQQTLPPNFPDLGFPEKVLSWGPWNGLVYSPNMEYAMYRSEKGLSLRNLSDGHVFTFSEFGNTDAFPNWSPDGSRLVFSNNISQNSEIYEIDLKGNVTQLTNLSAFFPNDFIPPVMSWSPDGVHIAFWLQIPSGDPSSATSGQALSRPLLAVLDTKTGLVENYCLAVTSWNTTSFPPGPIWSPDGTQIILEGSNIQDPDKSTSQLIVVDFIHRVAIQVGENLIPLGWMIEAP